MKGFRRTRAVGSAAGARLRSYKGGRRRVISLCFAHFASVAALLPDQAASQPAISDDPAQTAATPPMGWNPFNAFRLDYDEATILGAAKTLVDLGLADAGYRYVNIDDGWWLRRNKDGIEIRTSLFPSAKVGGKAASFRPFTDKLHKMGLKAGIYTDIGRNICSQRWDRNSPNLPTGSVAEREVGAMDHHAADARLFFTEWGFDFVKVDACGLADFGIEAVDVKAGLYRAQKPLIVRDRPAISDAATLASLYAGFAAAVRKAKPHDAPVLAICAWGEADVNDWAGRYGHMWRTSADIRKTWESMLHNFDSAAPRALFAGPGRWNDPDLLEIGNGDFDGDHLTEARAHMAMWAIIAAPLMLSYDLTKAPVSIHAIAGNSDVIAINQDSAGNQGVILSLTDESEVIVKQLAQPGRKAVALINRSERPLTLSVDLSDLYLDPGAQAQVRDLWRERAQALIGTRIEARLAPRETALFRVEGTPAHPRTIHPAQMPARITVSEDGFKPAHRSTKQPWIPARIGYSPDGAPIMVGGRKDNDAIGVAAGSRLRIALNGEFSRLHLAPGGDRASRRSYAIYGDGKLLRQGVADGKKIDVPIHGITALELTAPPAHDGVISFDWAAFSLER